MSGKAWLRCIAPGAMLAGLLVGCGKSPAPPRSARDSEEPAAAETGGAAPKEAPGTAAATTKERGTDIVTRPAKVAEVPAKAPAMAVVTVPKTPVLDVPARPGFEPLFKPDLSDAICRKGSWVFEDGILTPKGGGDIWTKGCYGDFVLDLEFRCEPKTNSGVFLRCKSIRQWLHTAIEVQILQPVGGNPKHSCGAIFDCLAPSKQMIKEPGEWNRYEIIAKGGTIYVILNGQRVIDMNLDLWTEPRRNPDGTRNKFKYAYKDMSREGHIGLQYHGHPVWFRNLRIRPLK